MKGEYQIEPEVLPFSREDYAIYRHMDTGKWFAVFIVKDRREFGLPGFGSAAAGLSARVSRQRMELGVRSDGRNSSD